MFKDRLTESNTTVFEIYSCVIVSVYIKCVNMNTSTGIGNILIVIILQKKVWLSLVKIVYVRNIKQYIFTHSSM